MLDTSESQVVSAVRHQVFIVDGHPIVRQGLKQLINKEPDLQVCGEAKERQEALEAVTSLNPDLAVVELVLREGSGLDLIKALQALMSELPILVVSIHDETLFAERALRAGARGYIMKQEATETLLSAIRRVLQGEIYVSERMTNRLLRTIVKGCFAPGDSSLSQLSDRELEVLHRLGQGVATRQIAETLHLSVKTVETYRAHIMRKLHLNHAPELLRYAVNWVNSIGTS